MEISGVNSLLLYRFDNKRILLLGETHHSKNKCSSRDSVDVSKFVAELSKRIPEDQCLDIFLEGSYKNPIFSGSSGLARTRVKLEKQKSLRIHHVDPRMLLDERSSIWDSYGLPDIKDFSIVESQFKELVSQNDLVKAIDYLLTIDQEENRKYFRKIFKVFEKLGLKKYNTTEFWEKTYFKIINKELGKLDETIISREVLINNLRNAYHSLVASRAEGFKGNQYDEVFGLLIMVPMDIYTLSRMFVKFNEKPGSSCNKTSVDNIIVHSGSAHTLVYEYFLNTSFGIQPDIRETNKWKVDLCLAVPEFDFWD